MGTKIYVGNLPYSCDADQLKRALRRRTAATSKDVAIITDRTTGQPRGFAFVQNVERRRRQEKQSMRFHGSSYGGRTLTVNEARPRDGGGGRKPRSVAGCR